MIIPKFNENQKHKILRNIRDLDLNAVNTIKQNISPEIQACWEPSKSLTLPRKIKTKEGDNNEDESSQSNRNFYSLPRPKTVKVCVNKVFVLKDCQ